MIVCHFTAAIIKARPQYKNKYSIFISGCTSKEGEVNRTCSWYVTGIGAWRDDGGWGDIARNDGWDGAGGGGRDRQRRLGVLGRKKIEYG